MTLRMLLAGARPTRLAVAPLILTAVLGSFSVALAQPCPGRSWSFASSVPSGIAIQDVRQDGDGMVLESGFEVGYFDIDVAGLPLEGKNIIVTADLVNTFVDGDFENFSGDIEMYRTETPIVGQWFSDAKGAASLPSVIGDDNNRFATIPRNGRLGQFFPIDLGESYRLSFDVDLSYLSPDLLGPCDPDYSPQEFTVTLAFCTDDADGSGSAEWGFLRLRNPAVVGNTCDSTEALQVFHAKHTDPKQQSVRTRIRMIDAVTHTIYTADDGACASTVEFNYTQDNSGDTFSVIGLDDRTPVEHRISYGVDDIAYAFLEFGPNWNSTGFAENEHYAMLDNVELYRENQVEVELLDATDGVLQSSTLLSGFRAETDADAIRIHLRSHDTSRSPSVQEVRLCAGQRLVVAAGDRAVDITAPRLGFTGFVSPWIDWNDKDEHDIRTEIEDPVTGTVSYALDYLRDHGVSRWRNAIEPRELSMSLNASSELEIELSDTAGNDSTLFDGEVLALRYANLADNDFTILEIIEPAGVTGLSGIGTDTEDTVEVYLQFAERVTELFSGGAASVTLPDGHTVTLPEIADYQVSVETNLDTLDAWYWTHYPPPSCFVGDYPAHVRLLNEMASRIRAVDPTHRTATSIYPTVRACYDCAYFQGLWPEGGFYSLDPTLFTYLGVNTFSNWYCPPEEFMTAIPEAQRLYTGPAWRDHELVIGAYSEKRSIYDPGEACDDDKWDRAYGDAVFAKRVARSTLSNLRLPAHEIYYYGLFDESWAWTLGSIAYDPLWRSNRTALFDRVEGTGVLGTGDDEPNGDADTPTHYKPNDGGKAFLTLGQYLSEADPYDSRLRSFDLVGDDEHYWQAVFRDTDDNWVIALWFFRDYDYATDAGNWLSGAHDDGFDDRRTVDIVLRGFGTVTAATLIPLDMSSSTPLVVVGPPNQQVVKPVPIGEMPVLIRLEL